MNNSLKKRGLSLSISKTKKNVQEPKPIVNLVSKPQAMAAPVAPTIRI